MHTSLSFYRKVSYKLQLLKSVCASVAHATRTLRTWRLCYKRGTSGTFASHSILKWIISWYVTKSLQCMLLMFTNITNFDPKTDVTRIGWSIFFISTFCVGHLQTLYWNHELCKIYKYGEKRSYIFISGHCFFQYILCLFPFSSQN